MTTHDTAATELHDQNKAQIEAQLRRWNPALLTPAQIASGADRIRELVLLCQPPKANDALTMAATASRFFADVAPGDCVDVDALLTEAEVTRWAHTQLRNGMPCGTLSNHLVKLRRFLRVRRGLPARLGVVGEPHRTSEPLNGVDRALLEIGLNEAGLVAMYVATVGAGLAPGEAAGGVVVACNGGYCIKSASGFKPVVDALVSLAGSVEGTVLRESDWAQLRRVAKRMEIEFTMSRTRVTFAVLAVSPNDSAASLFKRYALTRRLVDSATPFLSEVTDAAALAVMLRG